MSETWSPGANNRVAAIGLALISAAVTLTLWLRRRKRTPPSDSPDARGVLHPGWLAAGIAAALAWTFLLGQTVARAHMYWGDEGYFLNQLRTGITFHRHLYRDFEFPYGPGLFYWPALWVRALSPLHVSMSTAYLLALATLQAIGLVLLFVTVQALPLRRSLKIAAFVLVTFGTLNSLLGLNYTVFRFILPFAAITVLVRQRSLGWALLAAAAGEIAQLTVSPELGPAFAAAVVVYACWNARRQGWAWLLLPLPALASGAAFLFLAGPDFLFTLKSMANGAFTLLLSPSPPVLGLIFAVVVLAPLAVTRALQQPDASGGLCLAFAAGATGLLPGALGRCDPIHIFFNGIGFYLLSFVALNPRPQKLRRSWIVLVTGVFLLTQVANFRLYWYRLGLVLRKTPVREGWNFDEAGLLRTIAGAKISAPVLAPQYVIDDLTRSGQYVPGYFSGLIAVWDHASEARVVQDMRQAPYAIVAFTDPEFPDPAAQRHITRMMRLGLVHRPPRPLYIRGAVIDAELKANWQPVGIYGDYALFRKLR